MILKQTNQSSTDGIAMLVKYLFSTRVMPRGSISIGKPNRQQPHIHKFRRRGLARRRQTVKEACLRRH
jgi:hypothetical protein